MRSRTQSETTGGGLAIAREGVTDLAPLVIGVMPYAMAIGGVIGASSVPVLAGWAGGPLILAGTAQLTTMQMLDAGAAPLVIIASALLINSRLLVYSAALAPWFRDLPRWRRMLLAAPLLDQLYLAVCPRFERGDLDQAGRQAYYAGAALVTVVGWSAAELVGILVGSSLPDALGLEVAAPVTFAGILARAAPKGPALAAAITALVVAVLAAGLPYRTAILVAAAVGIGAGCLARSTSGEDR